MIRISSNAAAVTYKLQVAGKVLKRELNKLAKETILEIRQDLIKSNTIKNKTASGKFGKSWRNRPSIKKTRTKVTAEIYNDVRVGRYRYRGGRGYLLAHLLDKGRGIVRPVFGRSLYIPTTRRGKWRRPTAQRGKDFVIARMARASKGNFNIGKAFQRRLPLLEARIHKKVQIAYVGNK